MSTAPNQTIPDVVEERSQRRYLLLAGCVDCAGDLAALRQVPGVHEVRFLEATGVIAVDADPRLEDGVLLRAAAGSGLTLQRQDTTRPSTPPTAPPWWKRPALIALVAATGLVAAGLLAEHAIDAEPVALALFLAAIGIGGIYPVREALSVLRTRRLSIGVLLVAAAIGALALGRVEEAAELVVIFSLGEVLESYAADRARGSIRALMALTPPVAERLSIDGSSTATPVQELNIGDVVLVRPHQRIPTDGEVQDGSSWVDASAVTGESMPVETTTGAAVYGGTLNGDGALRIEVTTAYTDTVLARVIRQVEDAQASRGRAQRFAERFGAIYTPAMFALAALVALLGPLAGLSFTEAVYRALVILTVSCSCALVISVPVAVVTAIARGARDGILIKGGAHLEQLARIDTIAFDKTGTLTAGRPALTTIHALPGHTEDQVLTLAAAVEATSTHPIATAITEAAQQRRLALPDSTEAATTPGVGAHATVRGHRIHVGRVRPATDATQTHEALADLEQQGLTPVAVYRDDMLIGILGVSDQLRPDAVAALAQLRKLGIARTVILTGDHPRVAEAVAAQLGINEIHAGLLPEDKTSQVQNLCRQGVVAMVGDGVNDAPAMANAHVAIAMGAAGTDVALETADVALMADDLTRLPAAIRLARRARANITQNIVMSLVVITGLVAAATAGAFNLTQGIILNEGTALLIIANGLRLLRHKEA
ncbi:heavy metal translocating P-type ATPase [Pimelobacter simplex]|uniref:heavy metal translocating P-type ATPase n=1 Tax=Nocardioides simplex TaxID=2045 RepID=UPI002150596D|nr:cation-translocating P-type ATPase [Pimelobacter simplex]UUW88729.1 cadmium-translocating P-type ATPase [Pimelobacter simplex]UUW98234.1 cadmium-translocating P-type ATPase [Pimelobacter simplex]